MIDKIPQLVNEMDFEVIRKCFEYLGDAPEEDLEMLAYNLLHDVYNAALEHKESVYIMANGLKASAEYSNEVDRLTLEFIFDHVSVEK